MQTWMIFTPAAVALVAIVLTRKAALALLLACLTACLVLAKGNPLIGLRELFVEHAFPALSGSWHIGPVIFTLLLGAFAQLLERSGGFSSLMQVGEGGDIRGRQSKTLLGVFGMGLLCFFDGLANAMLLGRVARPLVDRLGMARQVLAYVIDSTSSAVACVAFISTWIATQLSLIGDGLEGSGLEVTPVDVYFRSIPANPYCWIALAMVAIVVARHWWIGPMKYYVKNVEPVECEDEQNHQGSWISVVVPVLTLLMSVPAAIYLFQEGDDWSWANAFAGSYVPHAMVLGGVVALVAASLCFPRKRWGELGKHMHEGASSLLPALLILWLAWTLGSQFQALGVAESMVTALDGNIGFPWFPLLVFITAAGVSFLTGSSWGTMGIFMPIVVPMMVGLVSGVDATEQIEWISYVVGAVFGGAVFGDHCSPFSDTTVVSSLSAGCSTTSHVSTQLPYALLSAVLASVAYVLMAFGVVAWLSVLLAIGLLGGVYLIFGSRKS